MIKILMDPLICRHNFSEFVKPVSSKGLSIDDIYLSSDDLEMYIDLAPFLNPSPYVVPEDMSLTKVIFSCLATSLHYCLCFTCWCSFIHLKMLFLLI